MKVTCVLFLSIVQVMMYSVVVGYTYIIIHSVIHVKHFINFFDLFSISAKRDPGYLKHKEQIGWCCGGRSVQGVCFGVR